MANSETYTALLKVQKWRDTPFVGVADSQVLCNDMHLVAHVMKEQSETIRRLKIANYALRTKRQVPKSERPKPTYTTPADPLACMARPVERMALAASL